MMVNVSSQTIEARDIRFTYPNCWGKMQPRILYPEKIVFKNKGEIKTKNRITSHPTL